MKKLLITVFFVILALSAFVIVSSAQDAYLEPIPENLLFEEDTVTHFIVFDDEKYYIGSGNMLYALNIDEVAKALTSLGISTSDLGTKYLTKFVFPAYIGGNLITFVDVNQKGGNCIKTTAYFKDVCGYVKFPGTMTKTNDMNECVKQLRGVDFGENCQLTAIPNSFILKAEKLKEVKNFPTAQLEKIEANAFSGTKYGFKGELVINAKYVGSSAFNNAITYVTSLVFGENLETLSQQSFSVKSPGETNLGTPHLERVEFKGDVTKITMQGSLKPFYFSEVSARTEFGNLKCIILSNPANKNLIVDGVTTLSELAPNSKIQFFADSTKDVVYTSHTVGYENATISYDSFLENGTLTGACTKCGKQESRDVEPLFTFNGFSTPENGRIEIYVGFTVNHEAIELYENLTGNKIDFGIVAGAKEKLNGSAPLDANGNAISLENGAVIKASAVSENKYASYELRISGFEEEAHKDVMLLMASYVHITDKDGKTISVDYLQANQIVNNEFYYVSYNSYGK